MKKITLSLMSIIVLSSAGFAEEAFERGFYLGGGLSAVVATNSDVSADFFEADKIGQDRLGNLTLLAGYDYNEYVALEGRYTTSFSHETKVAMDGWGLYVKPQYPVSESFKIYALLGFGGVTLDGVNGFTADVDDTGFQWGIGASYSLKNYTDSDVSLFIDYVSMANEMDGLFYDGALQTDVAAVNVGMTYRF